MGLRHGLRQRGVRRFANTTTLVFYMPMDGGGSPWPYRIEWIDIC